MATMQAARKIGKLIPSNTSVLLCDIQDRFRPLIYNSSTIVNTAKLLTTACDKLDMPCIITEQYPKAFGPTVTDCFENGDADAFYAQHGAPYPKKLFSMMTPEVTEKLQSFEQRKTVLLFGIEAHVCVQQTALDLLETGYDVHLVVDATSSQTKYDREIALQRMASSGVYLTTAQSALFMLLQSAEHPNFKEISKLVVEHSKLPNEFNA
eukprot:CAMPEP_0116021242 /NCGR_PEP_ID=MMETSP0321-20121206/10268_1 /TAXON_ID=163516 /ORGANISM="Leptocylindrus danicus var. danicus, Strain B650" /LENGTH=208 /DNA_ID=CAMNT_0003492071 /DNA_START=18 /DNA_END=644 /DNA_ORIENTATION=-